MSLVITVLDAVIAPARAADLEAAYAQAAQEPLPPGLLRSSLQRSVSNPMQWRIETIWRSPEALAAMRQAGKPRGIQIFEAAGASPTPGIFEVVAELGPGSSVA
jgi:hypothetical protein